MLRSRQIRCIIAFFLILFGFSSLSQAGLIRDAELESELEKLAMPMARSAGLPSLKIRIVPETSYNAFVMGRDVIYVHAGLLLKARSGEEILGVFAHEIGHLAAGHVPRRSEAIQEANLATTLSALAAIAAAASGSGDAAVGVLLGGTDQAKRRYLARSRQDEAIADEWALTLLDEHQISASGMADFMRRLASERALPESRQSEYYATHPAAHDRLHVFEDHLSQSAYSDSELPLKSQAVLMRLRGKLAAYLDRPAPLLRELRKAEPSDNTRYQLAILHYRRGNFSEALVQLDALISAHPSDPFYLELKGDILMGAAEIEAARGLYENAYRLSGQHPLIGLSLARCLIAIGQPDDLEKAATLLSRLQQSEPNWAFIYRQKAIALGRLGRLADADILLAEEALLIGDKAQARLLATRARKYENASEGVKQRADDILFQLSAQ
ncbi:MAG: M48 family metalloprotease [Candidatus Puniceispirillaceae bacterium]